MVEVTVVEATVVVVVVEADDVAFVWRRQMQKQETGIVEPSFPPGPDVPLVVVVVPGSEVGDDVPGKKAVVNDEIVVEGEIVDAIEFLNLLMK